MRIQYQAKTQPVSQSPETTTVDRWYQPLSEPKRNSVNTATRVQALSWSTFTPVVAAVVSIGWLQPLSTPVFQARALHASLQPAHTELLPTGVGDIFSSDFSSDFGGPGASWAETVSEDRWHQPFSLPVWPKPGLAAAQQHAYTAPVSEAKETVTVDRWLIGLSTPLYAKSSVQAAAQQAYTAPVSRAPESVSVDRWLEGLSSPVWARPALLAAQQQAVWWSGLTPQPPTVVAVSGWDQPLAQPYPAVRGLHGSRQQAYTAPISEAPERVSVDRWLIGLSNPVWSRQALLAAQQSAFWWSEFTPAPPVVVTISGWGQPFVQPYPSARGLHASQQQPLAPSAISEAAETVSVDRWLVGLGLPVWARPALLTASQTAFWWSGLTPPPPLTSTVSAWSQDLSRPYPAARGLHVSQQQASAPEPVSEAAEAVSIDRWLIGLSLPVWARPALLTASQTAFFAPTLTVDHTSVDRWHASLSLPVWPKPGLNTTEQQVYVAPVSEAPETTTVDRWHAAFSLPVWPKRGLYATEQQYQTAPLSEAPETTTVDRWHQPFSVPVRRVSTVYPPLSQLIFTAPVSIGWFRPMSVPVVMNKIGLHESFRPPTFFIPFPPFIPSPDREIIGRGGVRLIYGKGQGNRLAVKGKA